MGIEGEQQRVAVDLSQPHLVEATDDCREYIAAALRVWQGRHDNLTVTEVCAILAWVFHHAASQFRHQTNAEFYTSPASRPDKN